MTEDTCGSAQLPCEAYLDLSYLGIEVTALVLKDRARYHLQGEAAPLSDYRIQGSRSTFWQRNLLRLGFGKLAAMLGSIATHRELWWQPVSSEIIPQLQY